jgi:hypothetical protein
MYWEQLGLSGSPSSAIVDGLALWLQWAQTGILRGQSRNEDEIRYNLNQFWSQKAAYWDTANDDEKSDMVKLDIYAHGLFSAMDKGKVYSASPSYWEYWKALVFGGIPRNPDSSDAAHEGYQAATDASTMAAAVGQSEMAKFYAATAEQIKASEGDAARQWQQEGISILGIPIWAWLVGGAAILWIMYGPKVNR